MGLSAPPRFRALWVFEVTTLIQDALETKAATSSVLKPGTKKWSQGVWVKNMGWVVIFTGSYISAVDLKSFKGGFTVHQEAAEKPSIIR